MANEWPRFIVKDPQPTTPADREILKREIDDKNRKIDEYRKMVDKLKLENLDVFRNKKHKDKLGKTD